MEDYVLFSLTEDKGNTTGCQAQNRGIKMLKKKKKTALKCDSLSLRELTSFLNAFEGSCVEFWIYRICVSFRRHKPWRTFLFNCIPGSWIAVSCSLWLQLAAAPLLWSSLSRPPTFLQSSSTHKRTGSSMGAGWQGKDSVNSFQPQKSQQRSNSWQLTNRWQHSGTLDEISVESSSAHVPQGVCSRQMSWIYTEKAPKALDNLILQSVPTPALEDQHTPSYT